MNITLEKIEPNKWNPNTMGDIYTDLLEDMRKNGSQTIDPITISPKGSFYQDTSFSDDDFVIIDGFHRWKAAKELGWKKIPVKVMVIAEPEAKVFNYRKNRERGTLDPFLEGELFKSEEGSTQEEIALKYGVTRSYVSSRLGLLKLDAQVVKIYTAPGPAFKKHIVDNYVAEVKEFEKMLEENPENEFNISRSYKPEEPTEEDFAPRGTISTSHLEAISTLPKDLQVEVAQNILARGSSVRDTEQRVTRIKENIAREQRFQEALGKAKRKKCPKCGSPPKGFVSYNEKRFECSHSLSDSYCYGTWEYMKTKKDLEEELSSTEIKQKEARSEQLKEARANPSYVRMKETPEELTIKIHPWILNILHNLTEVKDVSFTGKRNGKEITISYTPAEKTRWGRDNLSLSLTQGDNSFYFWVESKDYKKFDAKSKINIQSPSPEKREEILRFFEKIVNTEKLPWESVK